MGDLKIRAKSAADVKSDPSAEAIMALLQQHATQETLRWAHNHVSRFREGGHEITLEAGILRWGGAEYPVIGLKMDGQVRMYATIKNQDFFTKGASPQDRYTPGPDIQIVRRGSYGKKTDA